MKKIRIGSGAGFGNDRFLPAVDLLRDGELDFLCLECLAERTVAMAQQQKLMNQDKGYNSYLVRRMEPLLPLAFKKHQLKGLKIIGVEGNDVFENLKKYEDLPLMEREGCLRDIAEPVAVNAYVGCEPIVEALKRGGGDVVITGRCADPALFLAPLVYSFGWDMKDYDMMGRGTVVGHLLECADQVSGGNFAIPGEKDVERLWDIGFPYADVLEDGTAYISKVAGTGGRVDVQTCT